MTEENRKNELINAFEELLEASIEYIEYKHSGDPWEEDARSMGEMTLNYLFSSGRFSDYKDILEKAKESTGQAK